MTDTPKGFERVNGVLHVTGGRGYSDPGEAITAWWAGERIPCCAEMVQGENGSKHCRRKPTRDPDANGRMTRCANHSADMKAKRKAQADARRQTEAEKYARLSAVRDIEAERDEIIQKIAEGHNDPRGLCADYLARLAAARGGT